MLELSIIFYKVTPSLDSMPCQPGPFINTTSSRGANLWERTSNALTARMIRMVIRFTCVKNATKFTVKHA